MIPDAWYMNDEIAQSEAANNRRFVRYWLHNAFLTVGGEKISKSVGNVVYLTDVVEKGVHPLAFRYFVLRQTGDEIARRNGWSFHVDGVHLNSRGGTILADLVQGFLDCP